MFERDIAEGITILNRHDLGWAHRINVDEPFTAELGSLWEREE